MGSKPLIQYSDANLPIIGFSSQYFSTKLFSLISQVVDYKITYNYYDTVVLPPYDLRRDQIKHKYYDRESRDVIFSIIILGYYLQKPHDCICMNMFYENWVTGTEYVLRVTMR